MIPEASSLLTREAGEVGKAPPPFRWGRCAPLTPTELYQNATVNVNWKAQFSPLGVLMRSPRP